MYTLRGAGRVMSGRALGTSLRPREKESRASGDRDVQESLSGIPLRVVDPGFVDVDSGHCVLLALVREVQERRVLRRAHEATGPRTCSGGRPRQLHLCRRTS